MCPCHATNINVYSFFCFAWIGIANLFHTFAGVLYSFNSCFVCLLGV